MDTEHSTSLQSSPLSSSLCITMLAPAPVYKVTHAHVRGVFISANINLRQHFTHSRTQYLTPAHNTSHLHTIPHTRTQYLIPAHNTSHLHTYQIFTPGSLYHSTHNCSCITCSHTFTGITTLMTQVYHNTYTCTHTTTLTTYTVCITKYSHLFMHCIFSHLYRYHNTHDTDVSQYSLTAALTQHILYVSNNTHT